MSFDKNGATGILFEGPDGFVAVSTEGIVFLDGEPLDLTDFHDHFEVYTALQYGVPIPMRQVNVYQVMLNIYHLSHPGKYLFRPIYALEKEWLQSLIDEPDGPDSIDRRDAVEVVKRLIFRGEYYHEHYAVLALFDNNYMIERSARIKDDLARQAAYHTYDSVDRMHSLMMLQERYEQETRLAEQEAWREEEKRNRAREAARIAEKASRADELNAKAARGTKEEKMSAWSQLVKIRSYEPRFHEVSSLCGRAKSPVIFEPYADMFNIHPRCAFEIKTVFDNIRPYQWGENYRRDPGFTIEAVRNCHTFDIPMKPFGRTIEPDENAWFYYCCILRKTNASGTPGGVTKEEFDYIRNGRDIPPLRNHDVYTDELKARFEG